MQSYLWNNFLEFLGLKLWYFSVGSIKSHFVRVLTRQAAKPTRGLKRKNKFLHSNILSTLSEHLGLEFHQAPKKPPATQAFNTARNVLYHKNINQHSYAMPFKFFLLRFLVVDVCKKPDICGDNYKCVNRKKSHSCICPSGFQITGRYKKCKGM